MINQNFIIFAAILSEFANLSYIIDTIKGKIRPNRVSFFLWALAPAIIFFGQIQQGVGIQSLPTFLICFNCTVILIATYINKNAYWKLRKFDYICGFLSLVGLVLWVVTKIGNLAIIFGILADGLACLPTIKKTYEEPKSENVWPYAAGFFTAVITLLTIKNWSFANSSFSIYIIIVNSIVSSFIIFDFKKLLTTRS
jgi:hypothetical protein